MKKVLAEKCSNEPEAQFPTFPADRIDAVCELVSFPGKKYFLKRLLAYWKLKRKSRGGAALLRNLESVWITDKKEPPAPCPLEEEDPVQVSTTIPHLIMGFVMSFFLILTIYPASFCVTTDADV